MTRTLVRRTTGPSARFLAAAACAWLALGCAGAWAQLSRDSYTAGASRRTVAPPPPKAAAPPALPGAQSAGAVPSNRVPLDLPPNEALFDAINRGDMAAARDALSRGADINARNILSLTPTELAVDLNRNDIAFMLLSIKAAERPRGNRNAAAQAQANPFAGPNDRSAARARPAPASKAATAPARPAEPVFPRLYANDGGTPVPSAGFLGFDERRATR